MYGACGIPAHHFHTFTLAGAVFSSYKPLTFPTRHPLLPTQTVQQSLEVAQEACNDLDLRATQVGWGCD